MSITGALSNAYSGLAAMSRAADTVSNNVSNALTEGYSRQELSYTARLAGSKGAGVQVNSVVRVEDMVTTAARRRIEADIGNSGTTSKAISLLASLLGEPGEPTALANRFTDLENTLNAAANSPDSIALQKAVLSSAGQLSNSFNRISQETSRIRMDADASISRQVNLVNSSLRQIESLNSEIRLLSMSGRSVAALEDQRQMLVDKVNAIIPIKQSQVGEGEIALFTNGGEILLNGSPRELGFTPAGMIVPQMSISLGSLSGLSIAGKAVAIGVDGGPLEGGSLAANFRIRDELAPEFHQQIDALARDLAERFQDPNTDPTLMPGDAGLFTDTGFAFNPSNEIGFAARITVNPAVDPSQGGDIWKLREGINAPVPGLAGNAEQLIRMSDVLREIRAPKTGMGLSTSMGATVFAQEITSFWAVLSSGNEQELASKTGRLSAIKAEELNAIAVDTDREMQSLLMIEKSYAANARVISVVDGLMKTLLEM